MEPPVNAVEPAAPASPTRQSGRRIRLMLWLGGAAMAFAGLVVALTAWGLRTEAGSRWLLSIAPGLAVGRTEGALLGGRFAAQDLEWRDPVRGHRLRIDSLVIQDSSWTWRPGSGAWLGFDVRLAQLGQLVWTSGPSGGARWLPPASLRTPVDALIHRLEIASLRVDSVAPVEGIQARLELGAQSGSEHQLDVLKAVKQHVALTGTSKLSTDAPYLTDVRVNAESMRNVPWSAKADLSGPLSSLDLQVQLIAKPSEDSSAARLEARARVQPFEVWALGEVAVSTQDLDLAALLPQAPRTRLSGHATIRSKGPRDAVDIDIQLDNAAPDRFSDGGLPILALRAVVKAHPQQPGQLTIGPFVVDAADRQGAAGRWTGSGTWTEGQLQLSTRLSDVQPSRIDGRLAAMRLSGNWDVTVSGLPSPGPAQWQGAPRTGPQAWQFASTAQLQGQVIGAPAEVQLSFEASGDAQRWDIRQLQAQSGAAKLQLAAQVSRSTNQRWQLRSTGELQAFDPRVWFPGDEATWGNGQNRLNGQWDLDINAPAASRSTPLPQWLPALLGRVDMKVTPSRLAGMPFQAELTLRQNARTGAEGAPSQARADIRLGSAQILLTGDGNASDNGERDRTRLQVNVPSLADLAPLAGLRPEWRPWTPRRGELRLQADLTGRWPAFTGQAEMLAQNVLAGPLSAVRAEVTGRLSPKVEDGLMLSAQVEDLVWQDARIKTLQAQVSGSLAQHRLSLALSAPLIPPAPLARALAWRQSGLTRAELSGSGQWSSGPADGSDPTVAGRWTGLLERVTAGDAKPSSSGVADNSWLAIADARIETQWDDKGQLKRAQLQPGQARSGPLTLRWTDAAWARGSADSQSTWRLRGAFDPLPVAPLMQGLQAGPDPKVLPAAEPAVARSAWSGNLQLGAQLDIRAENSFFADIRISREGGDLSVAEGNSLTPLDLEKAELRLLVQDGLWRFQPQVQGRSFGKLEGEVIARARATDRWPSAEAALQGRLDARVASLATWGRWLPAGWNLQGEVDASASLAGTWGAPAYNGQLNGERISVRNPLQGVDLRDGILRVRMDGETARIEVLSIRGGEGQLTAEGQARFGKQPEISLIATAQRLRVLGRVDRQLVVSGQTQLTMGPDQLNLQGRVAADSGFFDLSSRDAPSLDDDVVVVQPGATTPTPVTRAETSTWASKARVALDLDLGQNLRLQGRGLQTGLTGKLRLTTPDGRPNFQGTVQAANGSYAAYGQRLSIERGQINFNGALDRARLDILALRPNLDVRVGVVITGSTTDPRVRLYSEPDMSESDKLSWLVLGRSPEGLGTADTALLQRAAVALLAGEGESPSDVALRKLGLDDFSIRQTDGEVRDTVVSVGKQLGRRWYMGYERGVNATAGTWQLVYRAAQRFTLRAQSGSDSSLDIIWTWRFGQP